MYILCIIYIFYWKRSTCTPCSYPQDLLGSLLGSSPDAFVNTCWLFSQIDIARYGEFVHVWGQSHRHTGQPLLRNMEMYWTLTHHFSISTEIWDLWCSDMSRPSPWRFEMYGALFHITYHLNPSLKTKLRCEIRCWCFLLWGHKEHTAFTPKPSVLNSYTVLRLASIHRI